MERFLFVVGGTAFWLVVGGQGLHMSPLWVAVSTVLAFVALLGWSLLVSPSTYRPKLPADTEPAART